MGSKKQVLLVDFGLAVIFLITSLSFFKIIVEWWVILAIVSHTVLFSTALYMSEHNKKLVPLGIVCAQISVTILLTVTKIPIAAGMEVSLFIGIALGILGYRFKYGVLQPIPKQRLQQTSQQTSRVLFFR